MLGEIAQLCNRPSTKLFSVAYRRVIYNGSIIFNIIILIIWTILILLLRKISNTNVSYIKHLIDETNYYHQKRKN